MILVNRTKTERGMLCQEVGQGPLQPQLPPSVPKKAREVGSRFGFCSSKSTFVKLPCQDLEFRQIVKGKGILRFQNGFPMPFLSKTKGKFRQNPFFGGRLRSNRKEQNPRKNGPGLIRGALTLPSFGPSPSWSLAREDGSVNLEWN